MILPGLVARGTPTTPPEGYARPAGNLGENKKERPLGRSLDRLLMVPEPKKVFRSNPWVAPPVSAELDYRITGWPGNARPEANFFRDCRITGR